MKRAFRERQRTVSEWRRHLQQHGNDVVQCACELQPGRFRKGQRAGGCGHARCYLCHGEKLLGRPTVSGRRSEISWREWRLEL